jgi:hypothetical protein
MNNKLRILIDEGLSSHGTPTGIGLQALNLYKHLKNICTCDITDYSRMKILPRGIRKFSIDAFTNLQTLYKDYDVIHYQNNYAPLLKGKSKKIVTVHDLGVFLFPDTVPTVYVKYNQHSIKKVFERADLVITPSQSVKNEVLERFSFAKVDKIFVCNDGIRDVFLNKSKNNSEISERYSIEPFSYFFFLGSLSRRKNLKFILEVFIKAKKNKLISEETLLVLGGQTWWGAGDFKHLLKQEYGIKTLGYLKDEDILWLYRNCKSFVFPSLYEGFGMPIIEAMSQNIPIIISNIPTSIELNRKHNNQMFGFDLNDEEQGMNILKTLDKDFASIKRSLNYGDLSQYSFDNVAKKHLEIYSSLM